MTQYRILTGMNYRPLGDEGQPEVRREPGDVVSDLPPQSVGWLLGLAHIEASDMADRTPGAPEPEPLPEPVTVVAESATPDLSDEGDVSTGDEGEPAAPAGEAA